MNPKMQKLYSHQALITKPSDELLDLATFLDIPVDVELEHDHVFIVDSQKDLTISSFYLRRDSDVCITTKDFCEILMDIKAGMSVLEAFNKQGYTF